MLHVYRKVKTLREENESCRDMLTAILSYDEKPGIETISNICSDKQPDEINGYVTRNHDCRRLHWHSSQAPNSVIPRSEIMPLSLEYAWVSESYYFDATCKYSCNSLR